MSLTTTQLARRAKAKPYLRDYAELLDRRHVGPVNDYSLEQVLALLPRLPDWPTTATHRNIWTRGATTILTWLQRHPGHGWQQRWEHAGADRDLGWLDDLAAHDSRDPQTCRQEHLSGLTALLLCRVVLPSYDFLTTYRSNRLFDRAQHVMGAVGFARIHQEATTRGLTGRQQAQALAQISKIVLRTGKDADQLVPEDLLEVFAWSYARCGTAPGGLYTAWDLLSVLGVTPAETPMRMVLRRGPPSTAEMVDDYEIRSQSVRHILIRYLDERRPSMDHNSFRGLVAMLVGVFWADLERHHPGIDSLNLDEEVAAAWKRRLATLTTTGEQKARSNTRTILMRVRALYLDLQQWALDDPAWASTAFPSPVRKSDLQGSAKHERGVQAAMHQRVRERLPHLPALADAAEHC
jgi:hypothetical protein